jgi:hypothetical protein
MAATRPKPPVPSNTSLRFGQTVTASLIEPRLDEPLGSETIGAPKQAAIG